MPGQLFQQHEMPAGGTYNGNLDFKVRNETTSYITSLSLRSSGNVGINTTDPDATLHANGDAHISGDLVVDGSTTGATTYSAGDFAQGGIVFWVDETGQHSLVCAKEDQSTSIRWYTGTNGHTQAKGDGPYAGEANTSIIIAAQVAIGDDGSKYAARICNELQITEGGKTYNDWYLPSKEELNLMYQNKATIDATATSNGGSGFASAYYWSSTESSNSALGPRTSPMASRAAPVSATSRSMCVLFGLFNYLSI